MHHPHTRCVFVVCHTQYQSKPKERPSHRATQVDCLFAGEVGYLSASIKSVADARVGDTITLKKRPAAQPLAGYAEARPMVFCGMFPINSDEYEDLREALGKLQLNDAALAFEPEVRGWCCA